MRRAPPGERARIDAPRARRYVAADRPSPRFHSTFRPSDHGERRIASLDPVAQVRATLEASARVKLAVAETLAEPIARAGEWVAAAYRAGGKTLLFGNGGSAADAQHIAAEWVGKLGPRSRGAAVDRALGEHLGPHRDRQRLRLRARVRARHRGARPRGRRRDRDLDLRQLAERDRRGRGGAPARGSARSACSARAAASSQRSSSSRSWCRPSDTQRIQECHIAIGHAIAELVDRLLFPELGRS